MFCKNACTLEDLSEKIDGYLEEISEVTFNNLVTLNHPSIYHGHAGNTQRQRWFVFFEHPYDVEVESVYTDDDQDEDIDIVNQGGFARHANGLFSKSEYFYRVYYGCWVATNTRNLSLEMIEYNYTAHDQVLINYPVQLIRY